MKRFLFAVAMLSFMFWPSSALAGGKKTDPSNFPLVAKVLSAVDGTVTSGGAYIPNYTTGVGKYGSVSTETPGRQEIQIGDRIYITEIWGRRGGLTTDAGLSFPAAMGVIAHGLISRRKIEGIRLLVKKPNGKPKIITLEIVGTRVR